MLHFLAVWETICRQTDGFCFLGSFLLSAHQRNAYVLPTDDPVPPNPPKPKPHPNPNQPGSSGGFSDSDLIDGAADGGGGGGGGGGGQKPDGGEQADSPGVVPGIIGAVVVAVAGAISSFIAYQKKKLCFKENADQGEPSPKNQESTSADQTVQWSLLEK
uniref:CD99 molecule (Xg blood group) n=1 Tax=Ursus americanus TaxID=9643 RepID=A0A452RRA2_URSAM